MKRILVGLTWAYALIWVGNYLDVYAGVPTAFTATIGVGIGIFVTLDPLGRIWRAKTPNMEAQSVDRSRSGQIFSETQVIRGRG